MNYNGWIIKQCIVIKQTVQELMNQQTRILPHLNSYFLQRKAYENHRKKIQSIRNSITRPSFKIKQHHEQHQENTQQQAQTNVKYSIHTIREEIKNQLNGRISPWAKRQKDQAEKENTRLFSRIRKCSSTINRKEMERSRMKNEQIKERISRFIYNSNSNKTLLKCKHSLQILKQKERLKEERSSFNVSKKESRVVHSKSQINHIERYGRSQRMKTQSSQKPNLEKFYLLKNRNKIKSHFDKKHELMFESRKVNNSEIQQKKRTMTQIRSSGVKYFATEVQV